MDVGETEWTHDEFLNRQSNDQMNVNTEGQLRQFANEHLDIKTCTLCSLQNCCTMLQIL